MKWQTVKPGGPVVGDMRVQSRYAWFPTALDDGMTVWLEWYAVDQMFRPEVYMYLPDRWFDVRSRCRVSTLADYI